MEKKDPTKKRIQDKAKTERQELRERKEKLLDRRSTRGRNRRVARARGVVVDGELLQQQQLAPGQFNNVEPPVKMTAEEEMKLLENEARQTVLREMEERSNNKEEETATNSETGDDDDMDAGLASLRSGDDTTIDGLEILKDELKKDVEEFANLQEEANNNGN